MGKLLYLMSWRLGLLGPLDGRFGFILLNILTWFGTLLNFCDCADRGAWSLGGGGRRDGATPWVVSGWRRMVSGKSNMQIAPNLLYRTGSRIGPGIVGYVVDEKRESKLFSSVTRRTEDFADDGYWNVAL